MTNIVLRGIKARGREDDLMIAVTGIANRLHYTEQGA